MVDNDKKLECYYKVGQFYAITINPCDKYQFFGRINRCKRYHNFIYEQFLQFKCDYLLYIEISEPRGMHTQGYNGPRLHMHGTIYFENRKQLGWWLVEGYYKLLRFAAVDIDTIEDLPKWDAYCRKQNLIRNNIISKKEERTIAQSLS